MVLSPAAVGYVTSGLSALTVAGDALLVFLLATFLFDRKRKLRRLAERWDRYLLPSAFSVSLAATLGSLFFSGFAGYAPCELCWFQRIFMYPQPVLLAAAMWGARRDAAKEVARYVIPLDVIGAAIASYNYYLQISAAAASPVCSASAPCGSTPFIAFGYVTIPMMSLTAFLTVAALCLLAASAAASREAGARPSRR